MPEWAEFIGAFVRWTMKGFKTKFTEELDGILKPVTKLSYDIENMIIGYFTLVIVGLIIIWLTF